MRLSFVLHLLRKPHPWQTLKGKLEPCLSNTVCTGGDGGGDKLFG